MRNIILVWLTVICSISCVHKTNTYILPKEKFKNILVEIHLIDGYYMMNSNKFNRSKDSITFYKKVLDEYGCTRAQFDSSLRYYSKDPKQFDQIYDGVIDELNRMSTDLSTIRTLMLDSAKNLYKGKATILINKKQKIDKLPFEIQIKDTGLYEITIQMKCFLDDQSKNLHLTAFTYHIVNKQQITGQNFNALTYKNDNHLRVYKVSKRISSRDKLIKGYLLDQDDQPGKINQHVLIKAIFVNKIANANPLPVIKKENKKDDILSKRQRTMPHVP